MILDEIIEKRKIRLEAAKKALPIHAIRREAEKRRGTQRGFIDALKRDGLSVIAEVKKASPSKGLIREDGFDPERIALEYERSGADAVSVLTEEDFFQGSGEYLTRIKKATAIPVLRKDFIFDPWQVYESACLGADAVLLIAAALTAKELEELRLLAKSLGMDALVEAHDPFEMEKALDSGAQIVGINNRDLRTFEVRLDTTQRLIRMVPPGIATVSESGIHTAADIEYIASLGVDAALIGESLMRAGSVYEKMKEFKGGGCGKG